MRISRGCIVGGVVGGLVLMAAGYGCSFSAPRYRGPKSDHFDGRRFVNYGHVEEKSVGDLLRWVTHREPGVWQEWTDAQPGPKPPERVGPGQLRVTFINHATTLIQIDGLNVLTDPVWSERVSPVSFAGPRRVRPPGLRFEDLPPIDVVLISHNHYDHCDLPTLRRLVDAFHPKIYAGLGNARLFQKEGIDGATDLDWWNEVTLDHGVTLVAVPAQHFSNRGLSDRNATLWTGFVLQGSRGYAYFAGDSGYGPHLRMIRERFGPPRVALLPIGAYKPEWFMGPIHMSPVQALHAAQLLSAERAVAIHFGTFNLADDGQDEPVEALRAAMQREHEPMDRFWVLGFGEGRDIP
ncbi:MAG: MBL fold metallo-hydrolase [Myxococcaceae bacterium]|nr:MBL fold metallo-hydrolase [Myxococcaceae bacterium]